MMNPGVVPIGAVLAGRYRVERVLGQGGMGVVVKAMHLQLHQPVAMKFLLPEVLSNQQIVQRFLREAQAAVRLKSEHVARVIDVGSLETGAPYMVLEYLEGSDLSSFPRAQLSIGGIVDLMLQACEALAEAHSLGIVHRDIKPANFFITRGADGTPLLKVLDFGISKAPVAGSNLTATQSVMGTPAYMSPEQMRSSRDVDPRSDIWALGIVLYELLQGAPPFGGDTFSSMVIKVVTDPLPRLTVQLPGELDAIVYRCLEKDPAHRFQNVAELAQALAAYAQSETQAAISVQRTRSIVGLETHRSSVEPGPARRAIPSTISGAAGARTSPPTGGRRWPIFAALGVVAGVVAIAVIGSSAGRGGAARDGKKPDVLVPGAAPPAPAPTPAVAPAPVAATPARATPPVTPPAAAAAAPAPTPPAPAPTPPAASPTVAATPPAPTQAAAADPANGSAAAPPSGVVAKKPRKPTKPSGSGAKSEGSAARPQGSDDDILGTRN
ncbi:MAG TPA: serine/threonine-protein kinase [Kofleriaceae bacterium]|nr:serine/threonine-protein kinase [Kofleriaceae bacterium]